MKRITLILTAFLFYALGATAQIEKPVTWSYAQKKISNTEAIVYIKANIQSGWHIYSQNIKAGGPIKTSFSFAPSKEYVKVGATMAPKPKSKFEKVFDMDVTYHEGQVIFQQKVKILKPGTTVRGKIEYMACDATKCLPPAEVDFAVQIK
jgi:hypothetical protein